MNYFSTGGGVNIDIARPTRRPSRMPRMLPSNTSMHALQKLFVGSLIVRGDSWVLIGSGWRGGLRSGLCDAETAPSCFAKCNDGTGVNISTVDRIGSYLERPEEVHTVQFFVQNFWPSENLVGKTSDVVFLTLLRFLSPNLNLVFCRKIWFGR